MKILVTGTAGFIGYHLAESLLADGHQVVGVDNLCPYYPVLLKKARHARLAGQSGFLPVIMDLTENERLLEVVRGEKIEIICHLAAQPGVRYSLEHPFEYEAANLHAFLSVLEATRQAGLERLVYASSSSVYGGNTRLPFSESDPVETPVSLYAATKRANELMAHTYTHLYGFRTVGHRFFTVYGPWGRPDMATWIFAEAIQHNKPIKVFNHGKMRRDFTYIDDILSGLKASLFEPSLDQYELFNLGGHRSEELLDLIRAISDHLGKEPVMNMMPIQPGDVPATYADVEKASAKLGYAPQTAMNAGVKKFIDWFLEHPDLTEQVHRERGVTFEK